MGSSQVLVGLLTPKEAVNIYDGIFAQWKAGRIDKLGSWVVHLTDLKTKLCLWDGLAELYPLVVTKKACIDR